MNFPARQLAGKEDFFTTLALAKLHFGLKPNFLNYNLIHALKAVAIENLN